MKSMQIPLPLTLLPTYSWESFYAGDNTALVEHLQTTDQLPENTYIYSTQRLGKTHLLQATAQQWLSLGKQVCYLECAESKGFSPELLQELSQYDLICLDGLDHWAGDHVWELALFGLYNQLRDQHKSLIMTARNTPDALGIVLPDLRSRLQQSLVFQIKSLTDSQLAEMIDLRLKHYGFSVGEDVIQYLIDRSVRDVALINDVLTQLDQVSLSEKRALTKPLIKKTLGW